MSGVNMYKTWYYNYVACYWLGKKDATIRAKCLTILEEYLEIVRTNEVFKDCLAAFYKHFRKNILFIHNDDIVRKYDELMGEELARPEPLEAYLCEPVLMKRLRV